ncbi:MAG: hypothetical protein U1F33_15995 [Alphaproteobacteria bacterium]
MTLRTGLFAIGCWLALCFGAEAKDLDLKAFYGKYTGSGVANSEDSLYFGVTVRDTDVEIRPTADGFRVNWTTVLHQGGDPAKPDIRKRSSTTDFVYGARPNLFLGKSHGDPLVSGETSWARISGNSLIIYIFTINEEGLYDVQTYVRTLTGAGMDLVFSRVRDGEPTRTVKAKLTRQSN